MNLLGKIKLFFAKYKEPRYRDRRGYYASDLLGDRRDMYWAMTGEPETNPTDYVGKLRMMVGKAIEDTLSKEILTKLHFFGLHILKDQLQIGGSDPVAIDGYADYLLVERDGEQYSKPYVVELKTKNGYGAAIMSRTFEPSDDNLAQLGYYLRDLSKKGVTNRGLLLYILLNDANYAEMIAIHCEYNAETDVVTAYKGESIFGDERAIHFEVHMGKTLDRLKVLDEALAKKECPPGDYVYKEPLTPDFLATVSDAQLEKAALGQKILGHWRPSYSRYKNKQLQVDNITPEYTQGELDLLKAEYLARKPKSKKFSKAS